MGGGEESMKHRRPADEALTEIENAIEIELHGDSQGDSNRQVVAELRAWANVLKACGKVRTPIAGKEWGGVWSAILRAQKIEARRKP